MLKIESEEKMTLLFEKCPVCGGEIIEKEIEKVIKGGNHTATLKVKAETCLHCGERLYAPDIIKKFEEVRNNLKSNNLKGLVEIGKALEVVK